MSNERAGAQNMNGLDGSSLAYYMPRERKYCQKICRQQD